MIYRLKDWKPRLAPSCWVHETAVVIGRVTIGENASIWPLATLRADIDEIIIGEGSNIQDNAVIHVNRDAPAVIGKNVTVGHGAVLHGCKIGDRCLVGMKAVVMESEIGEDCLIAAGTVITPGKRIPAGSLVMGLPAKVIRPLTAEERDMLVAGNKDYLELREIFSKECVKL